MSNNNGWEYVPVDSILQMSQEMIRAPSQAGINDYSGIIAVVSRHLERLELHPVILNNPAKSRKRKSPCAIVCQIKGERQGPTYLLNATIDTAPVSDHKGWSHDPFGAVIENGRLYGRGSADSKTGAAIFAHVAAYLNKFKERLCGKILLGFDLDEHNGKFTGIKTISEKYDDELAGAFIGYSGSKAIYRGARGIARFRIKVGGTSEHSGNLREPKNDAVMNMIDLANCLKGCELPNDVDFIHDPRLSITHISAGEPGQYCQTAGSGFMDLDVRLTPHFNRSAAKIFLDNAICRLQAEKDVKRIYQVSPEIWAPAYELSHRDFLVTGLQESIKKITGRSINTAVSGRSNSGNFLSISGINAVCGYGVTGKGIHQKNEYCDIKSIAPVFQVYARTMAHLLGTNVKLPEALSPGPV